MDYRTMLYVAAAALFFGAILYSLVTPPNPGKRKALGGMFMAYGLIALVWPGLEAVWAAALGAGLLTVGFGLYREILAARPIWLVATGYCVLLLAWPEELDPLVRMAAAAFAILGVDRCLQPAAAESAHGEPHA